MYDFTLDKSSAAVFIQRANMYWVTLSLLNPSRIHGCPEAQLNIEQIINKKVYCRNLLQLFFFSTFTQINCF